MRHRTVTRPTAPPIRARCDVSGCVKGRTLSMLCLGEAPCRIGATLGGERDRARDAGAEPGGWQGGRDAGIDAYCLAANTIDLGAGLDVRVPWSHPVDTHWEHNLNGAEA